MCTAYLSSPARGHILRVKPLRRLSFLWPAGILVLLWTSAPFAGAQAETLSLNAYHIRIKEALHRLDSGSGVLKPEAHAWFRKHFAPGLEVRDTDGATVQVDHRVFLHRAREAAKNARERDAFASHLRSLLNQLTRATQGVPPEPLTWTECRAALERVYSDDSFSHLRDKAREPPWWAFLTEVLEALSKWLEQHWPSLEGVSDKWLRYPIYTVYAIVLILTIVMVFWIFRSVGGFGWRWSQAAAHPPSPSEAPPMDWRSWRERARREAEDGAFRKAIRSLFISTLVEGHQRGWWTYEPEATNREHLSRVAGSPQRRDALKRLIHAYEIAWYGMGSPAREDYQACEAWIGKMEAIP